MKKIIIGIVILFALAAPLFAQGSFSDVPTDHWAYDAVNKLQADGVIVGYPDGTFSGKRPLTRFEFAAALARAIPVIEQRVAETVKPGGGTAGSQGPQGIQGPEGPQGPAGPAGQGISDADFKALQQLVNEFRDELATLGVDVDALKRDIAALAARVSVLERYQRTWQWGFNGMVAGVATQSSGSNIPGVPAIDQDNRPLQPLGPASGKLINSASVVRDFDLTLTSSLSPSMAANVDIDFGNYIPTYLGGKITDYSNAVRSVSTPAPNFGGAGVTNTDYFIPYYAYMTAGLGSGSLKIGRMPMQLTPYTLKLINVDSYVDNNKTDSGNYPLDGGMINYRFGPVGATGFAAKCDDNSILGAGLISQPTAGLYDEFYGYKPFYTVHGALATGATGHAAGGLPSISQMGGGRLTFGTPFNGTLGATYLEAVAPESLTLATYDTVEVYGGDLNMVVSHFPISLNYTESRTSQQIGGGTLATINSNNAAVDGKIGWGVGRFNVNVGYKQIGNNFGAPGYWDKIGRWTNPTNVKGPYANLSYGLMPSVSFIANGEMLKGDKSIGVLPAVINDTNDKLWKAEGGLKWGFASASNVNLGIEYVDWNPSGPGEETKESYITLGLGHQINPSTGLSVSYQIIDYKAGTGDTPYGLNSSKGGVAVAEVKTKF